MKIIQALDRALRIIELFDEQTTELKMTEISCRMNLHKSTVHALLKTMMLHGYIAQDEETGKYRLGLKFVEKGQQILHGLDIRTEARPVLTELSRRTGQTAHLVILSGSEGVYIDKIEGEKAVIRYSSLGRKVPLHSSAVGKVLAAFQPEETLGRLMANYRFAAHTPRTITNMEQFLKALEDVRQAGYALDNEENEPGVRCVAAPVFDVSGQAAAAISISMLVSGVQEEQMAEYARLVRDAAMDISRRLGYKGML
jgi:DNA-binding IclR family transcriptional regulator